MVGDNIFVEQEHNDYYNTNEFKCWLRERVENSSYYKFSNVAPEGFVLVPIEVIESIKDFETWKEFKHEKNFIENKSKQYLREINSSQ